MEHIVIEAIDGFPLSAIYCCRYGKTAGTVVISSATGVKKEFYLGFADFLVQKGYTVLIYDYRGIGGSAPRDLKGSQSYIHEWGTKDMNAVLNYLVNERKLTNIIWIGHSIGGQLIGLLDQHHHIRKVLAVNAALGYWGYFPFPMKFIIWLLWYIVGPFMVRIYGYGKMKKIGWGENLPRNILMEWRGWCLSKTYFRSFLQKELQMDKFYHFKAPITAIYTSDDFIANDKTVPLMMNFFPNSPSRILRLAVDQYTPHKVGHTGIFRKKFKANLWPVLLHAIEENKLLSINN
jgi:predicted alpha/beta hydrolase